jgi:hypothetical protein
MWEGEIKMENKFEYQSPIEMIFDDLKMQQEDHIMKAIINAKVNVDKDELIRALQYDRDQYEKGRSDGINEFILKLKEFNGGSYFSELSEIIQIVANEIGVEIKG